MVTFSVGTIKPGNHAFLMRARKPVGEVGGGNLHVTVLLVKSKQTLKPDAFFGLAFTQSIADCESLRKLE